MTPAQRLSNVAYYDGMYDDFSMFWNIKKHHTIHVGYHDDSNRSIASACINLNRVMAQAVRIGPDDRVLDVGCGVGGAAVFLARECQARVTGINISAKQLALCDDLANAQEVTSLVDFQEQDLNDITLPPESFDVFWSAESVYYADSAQRFAEQASRMLKRGGRVILSAFFLAPDKATARDHELADRITRAWRMVGMTSAAALVTALRERGFTDVQHTDVTPNVMPSVNRMYWLGVIGLPYGKLLGLFGKDPGDARVETARSTLFAREMVKRGTMHFSLISAVRG